MAIAAGQCKTGILPVRVGSGANKAQDDRQAIRTHNRLEACLTLSLRAITFLICTLLVSTAFAELPAITLATVTPAGARAGTEVEVAITGADLDDAKALHFSNAGLTATLKTPTHFTVKSAPGVPVGTYDVRVSGRLGVSNPRAFVVGDRAEILKGKAHDKQEALRSAWPLRAWLAVINAVRQAATRTSCPSPLPKCSRAL